MFCVSWWNVIRCSKLSTGHELAHCHLVGSRLIQEPVKYGLDEAAQQRVSDNGGSSRPYYWIMRRSIIRAAFVSARSHFSIGWKVSASPLRSSRNPSFLFLFFFFFFFRQHDLILRVHVAVSISASFPPLFPLASVLSLVREIIFACFE